MDGHKKIEIDLGKLLVNPENYRFDPVKNQEDAMLTMLNSQKRKLVKLANDIAQYGLNPTKRLQARKVDGTPNYVALEGNRRLTILKLIDNPDLITVAYPFKSIFESLHERYGTSIVKKIDCVVYPLDKQDIADRWVSLEHTGENQGIGTVSWDTVQKQRFESRHKKKPLSRVLQVLEFLETKGIDTSNIDVTNLDRLISTPYVRQKLGIDFVKQELILSVAEKNVADRFRKVADKMNKNVFAVGDIYTTSQRQTWIDATLKDKKTTPPGTPPPSSGTPPKLPSTGYQSVVDPNKSLPTTCPPKIKEIYNELQLINISGTKKTPHAAAALLRILTDITTQEYLMKKAGFSYDSNNQFRDPGGSTCNELKQKLNYIANNCTVPAAIKGTIITLNSTQLITATLNQVMHNTITTSTETTVKDLWKNLEPVIGYLINEI